MHDFVSKNLSGFSTAGFLGGSFLSGGAEVTQNKWITRDFLKPVNLRDNPRIWMNKDTEAHVKVVSNVSSIWKRPLFSRSWKNSFCICYQEGLWQCSPPCCLSSSQSYPRVSSWGHWLLHTMSHGEEEDHRQRWEDINGECRKGSHPFKSATEQLSANAACTLCK